jgi:16S rRNA processing protein RimM
MGADDGRRIVLGRIAGVFGIKGWLKIESWTRPPENILHYPVWQLGRSGKWYEVQLDEGRRQGRGLVARLADAAGEAWTDRDRAAGLVGSEIAVWREQLPPLPENEFYWSDLVGLEVQDLEGRSLGRVRELIETPAHDMLVVSGEREQLIPYVGPIVRSVDLAAGQIRVDWDSAPDD